MKLCKFINQQISSFAHQLINSSAHQLILLAIITLTNLLISSSVFAQPPQKMSYQCVVRDQTGALVINKSIGVQTTILTGDRIPKIVFVETYPSNPATNENGLLTLEIGGGKASTGEFSSINWSSGPYFLKTEMDPAGGTKYSISGQSQLLSVPYALHANSAAEFTGILTETQGLSDVIAIANAANGQIKAVSDPTEPQDAATKAYVDNLTEQLLEQGLLKVKDADGNLYKAIKIGDQFWMAENLKTTKYNDGIPIPLVTGDTDWAALTTPGYCWFNNDEATYKNTFGAMYNWYTVATNKLCPMGWHIPTDAEWTVLTEYLINNGYGFEGSGDDIGKSVASVSGWHTNPDAGNVGNDPASNNSTEFTALPGGYRVYTGPFFSLGYSGHWWSSTAAIARSSWRRSLYYNENIFKRDYYDNTCGFYVRCLKD